MKVMYSSFPRFDSARNPPFHGGILPMLLKMQGVRGRKKETRTDDTMTPGKL